MKETIVLIPAYNPDSALLSLVNQLQTAGLRCVVVDDGSASSCSSIFARLPETVQVLHQVPNQGKGAALKYGMRMIHSQVPDCIVVTADADGQHLPADIQRVAEAAARHPGALVLGTRVFDKGDVPLRSYLGNRITEAVFRLAAGTHVSDTQTGLRAFDRSLIEALCEVPGSRYEYEMNQLLYCVEHGIELQEVPIQAVYEPHNPSSHFHVFRDSARIYLPLLKFGCTGMLSFLADFLLFGLFGALLDGTAGTMLANVMARLCSGTMNYEMNRSAVFHDTRSRGHSLLRYVLLAAGILFLNTLALYGLTVYMHMNRMAAKVLIEVTLFLVSFGMQRRYVFPAAQGGMTQ